MRCILQACLLGAFIWTICSAKRIHKRYSNSPSRVSENRTLQREKNDLFASKDVTLEISNQAIQVATDKGNDSNAAHWDRKRQYSVFGISFMILMGCLIIFWCACCLRELPYLLSEQRVTENQKSDANEEPLSGQKQPQTIKSKKSPEMTPKEIKFRDEFKVKNSDGIEQSFRWMLPAEAKESGLHAAASSPIEPLGRDEAPSSEMRRHSQDLVEVILAPWLPDSVQDNLMRGGVDVAAWPMQKLEFLAAEIADNKACLVLNAHGQIRRLMQIVQVIVIHPSTGQVIVRKTTSLTSSSFEQYLPPNKQTNFKGTSKDGPPGISSTITTSPCPALPRLTSTANTMVSSSSFEQYHAFRSSMKSEADSTLSVRRLMSESIATAAERCLEEKLNVELGMIKLNLDRVKSVESEETADFYQGLTTIVTRHIIQGDVATTDEQQLKSIAADPHSVENGLGFQTVYHKETEALRWCWQQPEETPELRKLLSWLHAGGYARASLDHGSGATPKEAVAKASLLQKGKSSFKLGAQRRFRRQSTFSLRDQPLEVLTPWSMREVKDLLKQYDTSAETLGMSFEELVQGASKGHFVFGHLRANDKLVIVEDSVLLKVLSHTGAVLVQTNVPPAEGESVHVSKPQLAWPSLNSQLHETPWDTARRISRTCLCLNDDDMFMETQPQMVDQKEANGRPHLTRKWLIVGRMNPEAATHGHLCADKL